MDNVTKINVKENSWLAALAARKLHVHAVAMTLGKTIHLHKVSREGFLADQRWVRHELAHVEQFRRYGFWRFIFLYLAESLKKGYYRNRFEVEARQREKEQMEQIQQ